MLIYQELAEEVKDYYQKKSTLIALLSFSGYNKTWLRNYDFVAQFFIAYWNISPVCYISVSPQTCGERSGFPLHSFFIKQLTCVRIGDSSIYMTKAENLPAQAGSLPQGHDELGENQLVFELAATDLRTINTGT